MFCPWSGHLSLEASSASLVFCTKTSCYRQLACNSWKRSFRLGFFATEAETNLRHTLGRKTRLDHHFVTLLPAVASTSDGVSGLGLGLETRFLKSRSQVSSRSRALCLETSHRLFSMTFCKTFLKKTVLNNDCSKFRRSKRPVAKLSLLLCCLRDGENHLPSTPIKIYTEFNKKCACTNDTAALFKELALITIRETWGLESRSRTSRSRSSLEIWARSRSRRLQSRLHHCF